MKHPHTEIIYLPYFSVKSIVGVPSSAPIHKTADKSSKRHGKEDGHTSDKSVQKLHYHSLGIYELHHRTGESHLKKDRTERTTDISKNKIVPITSLPIFSPLLNSSPELMAGACLLTS